MRISPKIAEYLQHTSSWFKGLSIREKLLVGGGFVILIPMGIYSFIYTPIQTAFSQQSEKISKLDQDMKAIPHILDRYIRFKQKKDELEAEFREVDITEGEKTFLENILAGKVDPGFRIDPLSSTPFGGSYEQASFNIKFTTTNLQNVVDVLTGISTGKKRMLLTSVAISKPRTADKLEVLLTASSIREKRA